MRTPEFRTAWAWEPKSGVPVFHFILECPDFPIADGDIRVLVKRETALPVGEADICERCLDLAMDESSTRAGSIVDVIRKTHRLTPPE